MEKLTKSVKLSNFYCLFTVKQSIEISVKYCERNEQNASFLEFIAISLWCIFPIYAAWKPMQWRGGSSPTQALDPWKINITQININIQTQMNISTYLEGLVELYNHLNLNAIGEIVSGYG